MREKIVTSKCSRTSICGSPPPITPLIPCSRCSSAIAITSTAMTIAILERFTGASLCLTVVTWPSALWDRSHIADDGKHEVRRGLRGPIDLHRRRPIVGCLRLQDVGDVGLWVPVADREPGA